MIVDGILYNLSDGDDQPGALEPDRGLAFDAAELARSGGVWMPGDPLPLANGSPGQGVGRLRRPRPRSPEEPEEPRTREADDEDR